MSVIGTMTPQIGPAWSMPSRSLNAPPPPAIPSSGLSRNGWPYWSSPLRPAVLSVWMAQGASARLDSSRSPAIILAPR